MVKPVLRSIVDLVSTLAMALAAVVLLWRTFYSSPQLEEATGGNVRVAVEDVSERQLTTSLKGVATKGDESASLVVLEFGDFQCPFCGRFARDTFGELDRDFIVTRKIQYAFRNFPLEQLHSSALGAARAGQCAAVQGRFWEMRGFLYGNQARLTEQIWLRPPHDLGLETAAFERCLAAADEKNIREDIEEGSRLGVVSTPTFLVGRRGPDQTVHLMRKIRGAHPLKVFEDVLTSLIAS